LWKPSWKPRRRSRDVTHGRNWTHADDADTWVELGARYHLGEDPYDPHDNILTGAGYLREVHDRCGSPGLLAAYDAGPTWYEEHLAIGSELPAETQAYVAMLASMIETGQVSRGTVTNRDALSRRQALLFVEAASSSSVADRLLLSAAQSATNTSPIVDLSDIAPQSGDLFVQRERGFVPMMGIYQNSSVSQVLALMVVSPGRSVHAGYASRTCT
jgi:hypothetical protein